MGDVSEHHNDMRGTEPGREARDRRLFNKISKEYAQKDVVFSSRIAREKRLLKIVNPVLEKYGHLGTIVDIGCGAGAAARVLSGKYGRYFGIDHSEGLIAVAGVDSKGSDNAEFIVGDIKEVPIRESIADTILAVGVFHHMSFLDDVIDKVRWIAKPGAYLVGIEPVRVNPIVQSLRWVRGFCDSAYSKEQHFFTMKELTGLLVSHGVNQPVLRYYGVFAPPFEKVVIKPEAVVKRIFPIASMLDNFISEKMPWLLRIAAWDVVFEGKIIK